MRRSLLFLLILLLLSLPLAVQGQVIPPGTIPSGPAGTLPETVCTNSVGVGLTSQGVLQCGPVVPAMTSGLAPAGQDVSSTGQVTSTHLTGALPFSQGGLGLTSAISGGILYFASPTQPAVTGLLPLNAPLFGGGAGAGPVAGTRSGTTLDVGTILGAKTPDKQLTFDANGNIVASPFDVGSAGGGGDGTVSSVFGRVGAIVAAPGDYNASQVTNAASTIAPNAFVHPAGQSMAQLILTGSITGTLTQRASANGGAASIVWPNGTMDFSISGGTGFVLRQSTPGGPFVVAQLAVSDLSGGGNVCTTTSVCSGYQAALGFTAENVANKSTSAALGTSTTLYPSQGAVKSYVDTALAAKQNSLGFTPEDVANKATSPLLGTSPTLYPSQSAVKSYVDTGLAAKQNALGFTPEDSGNKATSVSLGTSNTLYPSQNAVKSYVDTGLATRQPLLTWGVGLAMSSDIASVASTESGFLTNGGSTPLTCGLGTAGRMQVLSSGELQYCDGQTTAVLRSGLPTQSGLTWNVTPSACTSDTNGGKLTIIAGEIRCASDIGGTGGGGGVASVFGRTGAVVATLGDYSASQVTNAADVTAANVFTHAAGQSMAQLLLQGATSGSVSLRAPAVAGSSVLTFPVGSTNFTTTGGAGFVVRQFAVGGALTVGPLALSDLTGAATVCTTSSVCSGYQAALGFIPEDSANKSSITALGTSNTLFPTQNAVKTYVDTGLATKQASLGFVPEDSANKSASTTLGTSNLLYPTQNAVKAYVDAGLAGKQASITWGTGLNFSGGTASVASTQAGFLNNGGGTNLTCGAGQAGKIQVLNTGELQYCDGVATSVLQSGRPTQTGLRWNVTLTACTTDANQGKLTVDGTGQIICAADQGGLVVGFGSITAGTNTNQALVVGNNSTLAPGGTGLITANLLTGNPTIGSGSTLSPTGTGTITANLLTGTPTIGNGMTLSPTGTGLITANRLSGTPTVGSGSTLGPTGTGILTANALTGAITVGAGVSVTASGGGTIAATTAAALASDPGPCPANQFGIDTTTSGALLCAQPSLASLSDGSSVVTLATNQKLSNKQIVPRETALTPVANAITPACDSADVIVVNAISATLTVNDPSPCTGGNPVPSQELTFRFFSATPRDIVWGAAYASDAAVPLLTKTTGDGVKYDYVKFLRNSVTNKFDPVATRATAKGITTFANATEILCDPGVSSQCQMRNTAVTNLGIVIKNPPGTPSDGQLMMWVVRCQTAQTITYESKFIDSPGITRTSTCSTHATQATVIGARYSLLDDLWQVLFSTN